MKTSSATLSNAQISCHCAFEVAAAFMAAHILVNRCECCLNSRSPRAFSIASRFSSLGAFNSKLSQGTLHHSTVFMSATVLPLLAPCLGQNNNFFEQTEEGALAPTQAPLQLRTFRVLNK